MSNLAPLSNEADLILIGELTVENSPDRIAIYGALNITKDKAGLQLAQELKELIDATVAALQAEMNLLDHIETVHAETVKNPFG